MRFDEFDEMAVIDMESDSSKIKSKRQRAKDVLDRLLVDSNKRQTRKLEILEAEE